MNEDQILRLLDIEVKKLQLRQQNAGSQLLSGIRLKCPGGRDALTYCLSCDNCAVACVDQGCTDCYRTHLRCQRMKKIKQFHNQIEEKVMPSFILAQIYQQTKSIQNLARQMQDQIKSQLQTFKLNKSDKQMITKIKQYHSKQTNITKEDFIKHQQSKQQQTKQWFQEETNKFQGIINQAKQQAMKKFDNIYKAIYYQHLENSQVFKQRMFAQSNILSNKVAKNQMLLMLKDLKPIRQVRRVYCASTDAFLSSSFHSCCDNRQNLLYVVRNQFDKTYGGFSPCPISDQNLEKNQVDDSMTSFIYSLDIHTRCDIVKKEFSVRNSYKPKSKGNVLVSFGLNTSPNLVISQNSFVIARDNFIDMYGGAYQQNAQNIQELIGTKNTLLCKLKQLQVFQILFVPQQKDQKLEINCQTMNIGGANKQQDQPKRNNKQKEQKSIIQKQAKKLQQPKQKVQIIPVQSTKKPTKKPTKKRSRPTLNKPVKSNKIPKKKQEPLVSKGKKEKKKKGSPTKKVKKQDQDQDQEDQFIFLNQRQNQDQDQDQVQYQNDDNQEEQRVQYKPNFLQLAIDNILKSQRNRLGFMFNGNDQPSEQQEQYLGFGRHKHGHTRGHKHNQGHQWRRHHR